jgi:hypothetical protein
MTVNQRFLMTLIAFFGLPTVLIFLSALPFQIGGVIIGMAGLVMMAVIAFHIVRGAIKTYRDINRVQRSGCVAVALTLLGCLLIAKSGLADGIYELIVSLVPYAMVALVCYFVYNTVTQWAAEAEQRDRLREERKWSCDDGLG